MKYYLAILLSLVVLCGYVQAAPVQWPDGDGENDHYYQAVSVPSEIIWTDANDIAAQVGGYLVTITSGAENGFVFALIDDDLYWDGSLGPWIGGYQPDGSLEPDGGWSWVTGEPFAHDYWQETQPNNSNDGTENRIYFGWGNKISLWNDLPHDFPNIIAYIVEFDSEPAASLFDPVIIADPNLQIAIEDQLGITDPTPLDMLALTSLDASNKGITDLTGIEHATNLTWLDLSYNYFITDISPLISFTALEYIDMRNCPFSKDSYCWYLAEILANNPNLETFMYSPNPGICSATDINHNGIVNLEDFMIIANQWQLAPAGADSIINLVDFAAVAAGWTGSTADFDVLLDLAGQWLLVPAGADGIINMMDFAVVAAGWTGSVADFDDLLDLAERWLEITGYAGDIAPEPDGDITIDTLDLQLLAEDWLWDKDDIVWVYVDDPNFTGDMSRHETTNAQYCRFLNDALVSGDITVDANDVVGAGRWYVGEVYYNLDGSGYSVFGATNGGEAKINYDDGEFTVDYGFGGHPVTWVSWYGASAFCQYYGYQLPTEWEWQGVADFNDTYTYGCGTSIETTIANYSNSTHHSTHPNGLSFVGRFGEFGHGVCDMAGNAWEWTDSWKTESEALRVLRGGSWYSIESYCTVSFRYGFDPQSMHSTVGFRVCQVD